MDVPARHPVTPVLIAGALVLTLIAAACGSSSAENAPGTAEGTASASPTVTLTEFKIAPAELTVPVAEPLRINVKNAGQAPHTFAIAVGDQTFETALIAPGSSEALDVPALEPGSYEMLCTVAGHKESGMSGTVVAGIPTSADEMPGMNHGGTSIADMLAGHEASVKAFPAETEGTGAQPLKPTMDDGVKVFEVTAEAVQWEVSPGEFKTAMAYNGTVPGPELRVFDGDRMRVHIQNELPEPTTIHWHGMHVPNAMDGVPFVTQDPIMPGEDFTYEFTVRNDPGLYLYHSHFNATAQVESGLYGPIVVQDRGKDAIDADVEYTTIIGDGPLGFVLNGKGFPATAPMAAARGETVLLHLANVGEALHPMHLHGYDFTVIRQDGQPVRPPSTVNTLVVPPGTTFDVLIHANTPGVWAFHCHILSHVEGPDGMYGMVTALVVE